MNYIKPRDVISPKQSWQLFSVLKEGESGSCAYALGAWNCNPCIAFRWNGTEKEPLGTPQSRGHPTWMILDDDLYDAVIEMLPDNKKLLVKEYLGRN